MNGNLIGLRILLRPGSYLELLLDEREARQYIKDWRESTFQVKDVRKLSGTMQDGTAWAVEVEAIIAMHTIPLQGMQGNPTRPLFPSNPSRS